MTYNEFMKLAKENYNCGGATFYECWDERCFEEYVRMFGPVNEARAKQMFKQDYEISKEQLAFHKACLEGFC